MRAKSKLVSLVLSAMLVFGFALTASAQVSHLVSSTPTDVIQTGLSEVLGEVRMTKSSIPAGVAQTTLGGTINVLYQNVTIDNSFTGSIALVGGTGTDPRGITVTVTGGYIPGAITFTVSNIVGVGGQVTINIPAGLTILDGDSIRVDGVRGRMTAIPLNTDVNASLQAQPSTSNVFINVSVVRVARTNPGLLVATTPHTYTLCIESDATPILRLTEGFPGAFVANASGSESAPLNARAKYGATNSTWIWIKTSSPLPADVTIAWPAAVPASNAGAASRLERVSTASDGTTALYRFVTTDQAISDVMTEVFPVMPVVGFSATSGVGSVTVQAQLRPELDAFSGAANARPRFDDPYKNDPADTLFTINKCVTYLLFPFVTNAAGSNFDSGMAIANTSKDNAAFGCPETGKEAICGATPQSGTITFYGYPQGNTSTVLTATTPEVAAGDSWAGSLSFTEGFAGFQGYIIAVCQFQYAHGYAFITGKYNSGSVYDVAEGYLGLVIPDPAVADRTNGIERFASPLGIGTFNAGEILGQ